MLVTLYPNNELRIRLMATPLRSRHCSSGRRNFPAEAESLSLSIDENLRSESLRDSFDIPPPPPRGYGTSPIGVDFSVRARRTIARAGGCFGSLGGRESTVFLTGTIPGGTQDAFRAVSDWSAWIVHELMTHLPRLGGLAGHEYQFVWVWEWQGGQV